MRTVRRLSQIFLTLSGTATVIYAVTRVEPLREETDYFLKLVRRLNAVTIRVQKGAENAQADLERLRDEMHHSVERMCRLAGRTEEELALTTVKPSWRQLSPFRRDKAVARSAEAPLQARS